MASGLMTRRKSVLAGVLAACGLSGGCVERVMRITTEPAGARVVVNDEDVGLSPARFTFLWYGDYDIVVRKPGFKTVRTHHRVDAPWHQYPPFDLVAETMIATTIRDEHDVPLIRMEPDVAVPAEVLVERATQLRDETLYGGTSTLTTPGAASGGGAEGPATAPAETATSTPVDANSSGSAGSTRTTPAQSPVSEQPASPAQPGTPANPPRPAPARPTPVPATDSSGLQIRTISEGAPATPPAESKAADKP